MRIEKTAGLAKCRIGIAALALSCLAQVGSALAQEPTAPGQSVQAGAAVFGSHGCSTCHSASGEGQSLGPDLRTATSSSDAFGIAAALWNHLPQMGSRMDALGVPRPTLSAREAADLLAFVYAIGASQGAGSAEAGQAMFRSKECIRCHRVGSVGGVIGPALDRVPSLLSPNGLAAGLWNHSGGMIPRMRELGIAYPSLSAADISNLVALLAAAADPEDAALEVTPRWVLPGDPGRGEDLVTSRACTLCHTVGGRGAGTAPELAPREARRTQEAFLAALWNKGPSMRAAFAARGEEPPSFEPGEMADLTAYFLSLGYFSSSGNADRGREVLRRSGCLSCHGWGAAGSSAADLADPVPDPEIAGRIADLWNHVAVAPEAVDGGKNWPALSRTEIADVLEYLGTESR
jgi:mono/diheme cytochrome c family protein